MVNPDCCRDPPKHATKAVCVLWDLRLIHEDQTENFLCTSCFISPKSLPNQREWRSGGGAQTSYSNISSDNQFKHFPKFHFGTVDPSQGRLVRVISRFWETRASQVRDFLCTQLSTEQESSATLWVFTSLALMITNFFDIIKTLFYVDCSLGHGRS